MCAIRGAVVTNVDDEGDAASPRSMRSPSDGSVSDMSSSNVSQCSQELDMEPAALWQRTIPKGRRCRPLSFSGLIVYDATGNQLDYCPRLPRQGREDCGEMVD